MTETSDEIRCATDRIEQVKADVAEAARRSGRTASDVEVLCATKYVDSASLPHLRAAGIELVGENRLQDLAVKQEAYGDDFTWDFIGHVQSRKVREIAGRVRLIHAIDSESAVDRLSGSGIGGAGLLLQVNLSGEASKSGVAPESVDRFLDRITDEQSVVFSGLMTMPPRTDDPEASRRCFAALRNMSEELGGRWSPRHRFSVLSMGTSQDYRPAVEEGATIIRVGAALLGGFSRPGPKSAR